MNANSQDPLRFLKPRKKQFHLTPTKPNTTNTTNPMIPKNTLESVNTSFNNSCTDSIKNILQQLKQTKEMSKINHQLQQSQSNLKRQIKQQKFLSKCNSKNPIYNPMKYFSQEVQNFLRKKRGQSKEKFVKQESPNQYFEFVNPKKQSKSFLLQTKGQMQQKIILTQPTNVTSKDTLKMGKHFQNQKDKSSLKENKRQLDQKISTVTQNLQYKKLKNNQQSSTLKNHIQRKVETKQIQRLHQSSSFEQNQEEREEQKLNNHDLQVQLKQCQICSRKFNPISYQKHIRICQKVFYKKRKEFSSEKQRSLSAKKK